MKPNFEVEEFYLSCNYEFPIPETIITKYKAYKKLQRKCLPKDSDPEYDEPSELSFDISKCPEVKEVTNAFKKVFMKSVKAKFRKRYGIKAEHVVFSKLELRSWNDDYESDCCIPWTMTYRYTARVYRTKTLRKK